MIDPDDLLLNNILIKAYETAKYYNLDILQLYIVHGKHFPTSWKQVKYQSGIICGNSNVRNIFYYGATRNLCDKLIRRAIYLNLLSNIYIKYVLYKIADEIWYKFNVLEFNKFHEKWII